MFLPLALAALIAVTATTANAQSQSKSQLLAKQTAAMTHNSSARVVNGKIYVPTTTRFDNRAPTTTPQQQRIVNDALSRGRSMDNAQSLAKNGPSFTSLNPSGKVASKPPVCTNGQYMDPKTRKWVPFRECR